MTTNNKIWLVIGIIIVAFLLWYYMQPPINSYNPPSEDQMRNGDIW